MDLNQFSKDIQPSIAETIAALQKLSSYFAPAPKEDVSQFSTIEEQSKVDICKLNATLYTELEPINETMSKGRVRIFYTGLNRNRTYISEDFANQLINSLPYTPVKGIFNKEDMDFTDHGEKNQDGRIYGLVMAEPNFAWEKHLDDDGEIREYACADVLYYTALYPEANLIPGDSESMEIYQNTLKGEWKTWEDGLPYFHFYQGSLLGLQILGAATEPCFEGASFYSYDPTDLQYLINSIKNIEKKEANTPVEKTLFRLSDNEKAEKISVALNPNFNEEGNWEISSIVLDVYDDYALIGDMATGGYKRAYYAKDGDNITISDIIDVKIVDVSETEYNALEAMKAASGTYEAAYSTSVENSEKISEYETIKTEYENAKTEFETIKADYAAAQEKVASLETQINEFNATIEAKDAEIANATAAQAEFEAKIVRLESENNDITNEKNSLAEFKATVEKAKKEEILANFSEHLTDEMIDSYKEKLDEFSVEDFKKEVCMSAYENDSTALFNKQTPEIYPKDSSFNNDSKGLTGVEKLLEDYKRGGNK